MSRSTFRKAVLATTMVLLLPGLALASADSDREGRTGTHKLKCNSRVGSFYNPNDFGEVTSTSLGRCSAGLGKVATASQSLVSVGAPPGCVFLTSLGDDFTIGKKAFITFTNMGTQCFEDSAGDLLGADWDGTFCGGATSAFTSVVAGTYAITGGLVKGRPVIGGEGSFTNHADHCAGDAAPFGNFFSTKLRGTIEFQ